MWNAFISNDVDQSHQILLLLLLLFLLLAIIKAYLDLRSSLNRYSMEPNVVIPISQSEPTRLQGRYCALVVCWILGIGCLFSWHTMLASVDYYAYMFPNYHPSRVLSLVYQPFSVGALAILAYYEAGINTRKRNLAGYLLFFISTFLVLILDLATSGKGGTGTFIGICICSAAYGIGDAHVQGGMIGELSCTAPEFMQSFLGGLAASGALATGLRLITKAVFENSKDGLRQGAITFFAVSAVFEFLCVVLYANVFPKLPIIKYYCSRAASDVSKAFSGDLESSGCQSQEETDMTQNRLSAKALLMENLDYALDLFLIYILTYSIFPGFVSEDTCDHTLGSWYALVLIGIFNVADFIGRYIPLYNSVTIESRKGLMCIILARFALIPSIYSSARFGHHGSTILLTSFLGLSNGYLTVCVLTTAPRGYKVSEQNALGNILVLFLLAGVLAGITAGWLWLLVKSW